jgi:hypothetical protein
MLAEVCKLKYSIKKLGENPGIMHGQNLFLFRFEVDNDVFEAFFTSYVLPEIDKS